MYHAIKEKGPTIGIGLRGEPSADFFRDEYEMNYLLANSPIPQVISYFIFYNNNNVDNNIFI